MRYIFKIIAGTNTTYLSNAINDCFKCNFSTLVNSYRIRHAKKILESGGFQLADIPGQCGFSSRSAFYAAFSKEEGNSPLYYQAIFKALHNQRKKKRPSSK